MHLREQLLTADEMAQRLRVAGAAVLPEEIGIASGAMAQYARRAMFIRRRFTIFDVAWRLGIPL
ncbi:MAG: sn-glycerol-1-phosphate dehydrogenase [Lentisphaerae bacterium]|nr:sn-glycerol-1-phosphate dehydrogenase [Lentisphaerota bacterium]